jgi:pimeloyl-ACP methyl ester carboxylesterase
MAVYVLVHGAWTGANGSHTVRRLLQRRGHEVFTLSLIGLG